MDWYVGEIEKTVFERLHPNQHRDHQVCTGKREKENLQNMHTAHAQRRKLPFGLMYFTQLMSTACQ